MSPGPPLLKHLKDLKHLTYSRLLAVDVLLSGMLVVFGRPADAQLARSGLSLQLLYVLLTVSAGSVAIRRLRPLVALGMSLAGFLGSASYGFVKFPAIPVALTLYLVAVARPRRAAVGGLIVAELLAGFGYALAGLAGSHASLSFGADWRGLWFGQGTVLLAFWTTGFMLRTQREYERGLHAQAERRAQARIDEALRTVTRERMRIARELHDVVAHSMSVIAVQAGVGHHVIGVRPEEAAKALAAIETTSRAALREMRALLGVLREEIPDETTEEFLATRAGASGFLLKDTPPNDLLAAIRVIADGEALLSPRVTRRLVAEFAKRPAVAAEAAHRLDGVTEREREVLVLIARGLSNTEIAAELYLSIATAKSHVGRLLTKLGARDRAQLVIAAYEAGLVTLGAS